MLEIILLSLLARANGRKAAQRGRKPGRFIGATVALWIGLELLGGLIGSFFSHETLRIYGMALLGAALGAFISWQATRNCKPGEEGVDGGASHPAAEPAVRLQEEQPRRALVLLGFVTAFLLLAWLVLPSLFSYRLTYSLVYSLHSVLPAFFMLALGGVFYLASRPGARFQILAVGFALVSVLLYALTYTRFALVLLRTFRVAPLFSPEIFFSPGGLYLLAPTLYSMGIALIAGIICAVCSQKRERFGLFAWLGSVLILLASLLAIGSFSSVVWRSILMNVFPFFFNALFFAPFAHCTRMLCQPARPRIQLSTGTQIWCWLLVTVLAFAMLGFFLGFSINSRKTLFGFEWLSWGSLLPLPVAGAVLLSLKRRVGFPVLLMGAGCWAHHHLSRPFTYRLGGILFWEYHLLFAAIGVIIALLTWLFLRKAYRETVSWDAAAPMAADAMVPEYGTSKDA